MQTDVKMRAATYVRVSSEDQVDGYSLDAQRRAIAEFCQARDWDITRQYADEGKSAWVESAAKRPEFNQMLTDAGKREFDVVVTHSLDRLSRNLMVTLNAFHTFASNGVTYVSATQEIDYSTPEGTLFMTMVAAFAQYFSDNLSGHTKKGLRERVRQGLFNGEPPFGYQRCDPECLGLDESHTGCHPDPETAQIVAELFERYAGGSHSQATLAQWMNRQGFRTKARESRRGFAKTLTGSKVAGSPAFRSATSSKNHFYTGKVLHKQEQFDGRHQPIVDQSLFDAVQKRKKENRSRKTATVNRLSKNPHMLTPACCDVINAGPNCGHNSRATEEVRITKCPIRASKILVSTPEKCSTAR